MSSDWAEQDEAGGTAAPAEPVPSRGEILRPHFGGSDPLGAGTAPETADGFFANYAQHIPPPVRFPNVADVGLMLLLLVLAWLLSGMLTLGALHLHVFGISTMKQAATDVRYNLGSQSLLYVFALAEWALVFGAVWRLGLFRGLEWRAEAAVHARWRIVITLFVCLMLALIDAVLLPGPANAPIEDVFRQPGAAWLLFAFGITLAPLMEEIIFRGFLLPALCTAWEWTRERVQHGERLPLDAEGKTQWSVPAMVGGSLLTSVPFALIHAPQTAYSLGPFLLLVCVSCAFCWVRLSTRSLAASAAVHACYNLSLFFFMFLGTGGFRHLEKV